MRAVPRPSHADYTYQEKYKTRSVSGGGRASARETIGRVASGAIAEKWLKDRFGVEIVAFVSSVSDIELDISQIDLNKISKKDVDASLVRCPDLNATESMIKVRGESFVLTGQS
jgi:chorismate synthase